jgi:hypothetical protein
MVQVFAEGRAVGGGRGLRITGAGCQWDPGDGVAKILHKRFCRCMGGNGIIVLALTLTLRGKQIGGQAKTVALHSGTHTHRPRPPSTPAERNSERRS